MKRRRIEILSPVPESPQRRRSVSRRVGCAVLALAALAASCSGPASESDRVSTGDSTAAPGGPPHATAWVSDGALAMPAGDVAPDRSAVASIDRIVSDADERIVIRLARGEPSGGTSPLRAELRRDLGVLRVWLPASVYEPSVSERRFDDGVLCRAAYVVRSLDQAPALFVDLHLAAAAEARAELAGDSVVTIVLRPGGAPLTASHQGREGRRVVVVSPATDRAARPLVVAGYARVFESTVAIQLSRGGRAVVDTFTTAADWSATWGEFRLTLAAQPAGAAELFVGEHSAQDGSLQGIRFPVELLP